jgi:sterol desaturase/sphingolipid hydroxylase (fatty acid hydroxylase superfamily)
MHRIHHGVDLRESNRNFGFALPWWDRLFGTYLDRPAAGSDGTTLGLAELQTWKPQTLIGLLLLPFKNVQNNNPEAPG